MRMTLVAVLALLPFASTVASAQACPTALEDTLCKASADAGLDDALGDYGWIVVAFLALLLVIAVVNFLIWLLGPKGGPRFGIQPREQVREVGPGGSVQLVLDIENRRRKASLDLWIDVPPLPAGWNAAPFAAVAHASGWTTPVALSRQAPLHLSSVQRGAHKAAVAVQLSAPAEADAEETVDVPVRVVPVTLGTPRPGKSAEARYSVLLTTRRPVLQIANVMHDPERIAAGRPVTTRATVQNAGEVEARDVAVTFLLNEQQVDQKSVPLVPAKGEAAVEFSWTPTTGENKIRISAI
jgi:CARDB protein